MPTRRPAYELLPLPGGLPQLGRHRGHPYEHARRDGLLEPRRQSGIGVCVDPTSGHDPPERAQPCVLSADGITPVPVDDVQAFLPVHTGLFHGLSARQRRPGVRGHVLHGSRSGDQRTKTITVNDWRDNSNLANMTTFAHEFLDSVKDIVYEGSIPYYGLLTTPLTIGHRSTSPAARTAQAGRAAICRSSPWTLTIASGAGGRPT